MRSRRTPPASNATRAKYGKELRPMSSVPSMSATTVCFSRPIEVHLFTVGKVVVEVAAAMGFWLVLLFLL